MWKFALYYLEQYVATAKFERIGCQRENEKFYFESSLIVLKSLLLREATIER
jgi:hypothetical protein